MNRQHARLLAALTRDVGTALVAATAAVVILAAMASFPVSRASGQGPTLREWTDRLEQLQPNQPRDYFRLAEDMADRASNAQQLALARQLFGLAATLDPDRYAASACLALAALEPDAMARRRLLALARLMQRPTGALHDNALIDERIVIDALEAAEVGELLSQYRIGQGARVHAMLRQERLVRILRHVEHALPGGIDRLRADAQQYRNRPPAVTDAAADRMLRIEEALLAGTERSWTSDLQINEHRPLIEVDPAQLEMMLGVDPTRALYRDGQWVRSARD